MLFCHACVRETNHLTCDHCGSDFVEEVADLEGDRNPNHHDDDGLEEEEEMANHFADIIFQGMNSYVQQQRQNQQQQQQETSTTSQGGASGGRRPEGQDESEGRRTRPRTSTDEGVGGSGSGSGSGTGGGSGGTRPNIGIAFVGSNRSGSPIIMMPGAFPFPSGAEGAGPGPGPGAGNRNANENENGGGGGHNRRGRREGGNNEVQDRMIQEMMAQIAQMFDNSPYGQRMGGSFGDFVLNQSGLDDIMQQLMEMHARDTAPHGASQEVLDALPKLPFKNEVHGDHKECQVCQEDYTEGLEIIELPCKHYFHPGCILPWLKLNGTCPVCRGSLIEKEEKTKEREGSGSGSGSGAGQGSGNMNTFYLDETD